jgi:coenzyme F420-0:L-glutamate ligase/coenzyme F420-1:gamma-L-glutamate ligase
LVEIFPVKFKNPVKEKANNKKEITLRTLEEIENNDIKLQDTDILVITSKIVSILEGRMFKKSDVTAKKRVKLLARLFGLHPAVLQRIFDESRIIGILPQKHISRFEGVLEHQLQFSAKPEETIKAANERFTYLVMTKKNKIIMDSAGMDTSNIQEGNFIMLPEDTEKSARNLRKSIEKLLERI